MSSTYSLKFTAKAEHIDENGHVNNGVWVRWMEELATAHWLADGDPAHIEAYAWVVTRHEIDYRGNVAEGEEVSGVTEIREGPRGARFNRHISFTNAAGKTIVSSKSSWAMVDRESRRLMRVPTELAEQFQPDGGWIETEG